MRIFDNEEKRIRFIEEFKKVDEFYAAFKKEFEAKIGNTIKSYHPDFKQTEEFDELLGEYAIVVLSSTHTVLDKDATYPDYRKTEDLTALKAYYAKAVQLSENKELADRIFENIKELAVKYYPKIIDLSGDGFRLLDLNLRLFNLEFVASFNNLK